MFFLLIFLLYIFFNLIKCKKNKHTCAKLHTVAHKHICKHTQNKKFVSKEQIKPKENCQQKFTLMCAKALL